jgi:hypothetical protein
MMIFQRCLTAAMVFYLATAAQKTLSSLRITGLKSPDLAEIEVLENVALATRAKSGFVVSSIVADGRLLRWQSVRGTETWDRVTSSLVLPALQYRPSSGMQVLRFSARRFFATFEPAEWSGVVRIKRDGVVTASKYIHRTEFGQMIIEDPVAPQSAAIFVGALLIFGPLAWRFGPVRPLGSGLPWLLLFLAILHLLFWASQPVGTTNDSNDYLKSAVSTAAGTPGYFPPGYGAFLAAIRAFAGANLGLWTTLAQHAMAVVIALWIFLLASRFLSHGCAFAAALVAGCMPPVLTTSQSILSEVPTTFAMVGTLYFAVRFRETGRLWMGALSGLAAGWAIAIRVVPFAALIPAI